MKFKSDRLLADLRLQRRAIIDRYSRPSNLHGLAQTLTTLAPLAALWWGIVQGTQVSYALTAAGVVVMAFLLLRAFVLMHECGHASLYRSAWLNRACGFVFGVISGMPAYVWSQHHAFHHSTNGDWEKYRGPLNIIALDDYRAMNVTQQRRYRQARAIWLAPFGGFMYLIVMPRYNWVRGTVLFVRHLIRGLLARPRIPLKLHMRGFQSPYWSSAREYWHMFANNGVLILLWGAMAWLVGPLLFALCYVVSLSLAGGAGIMLFTVQHNFEKSYASASAGWDYHTAVLEGTSFLKLPRWLNWFTANIGYHHIHHLSARIPNYRLAACHDAHAHLFTGVTCMTLKEVPRTLRCILWDRQARCIVAAG